MHFVLVMLGLQYSGSGIIFDQSSHSSGSQYHKKGGSHIVEMGLMAEKPMLYHQKVNWAAPTPHGFGLVKLSDSNVFHFDDVGHISNYALWWWYIESFVCIIVNILGVT